MSILGVMPMYIQDFLRGRGIWFEGLLYQPASSSAKRARNARITGCRVAKAVRVRAVDSFLLAVLPASCRIDLDRLSQVLGRRRRRSGWRHRRTAGDVSRLRAGGRAALRAARWSADVGRFGLPETGDIVVSANTRHEGLWMHFRDFAAIEGLEQASFSRPISPGQGMSASGQRRKSPRVVLCHGLILGCMRVNSFRFPGASRESQPEFLAVTKP